MNIYSNIEKNKLMHVVNKKSDITYDRKDIVPNYNPIQVACFKLANRKTFKAHKHIEKNVHHSITQESWVVIKGRIKATLYDIDDSILKEIILEEGDCSITLLGGHNYESLEEGSIVYEFKTGPYFGQEKDKIFI